MESNRQLWPDVLKGLLMVLVVVGHSIMSALQDDFWDNHFFNLIMSFHMPAFMAISGYFAYLSIGGYFELVKKRARQLFLPWLSWTIVLLFLKTDQTLLEFVKLSPPFWFLWVLFVISVIFYSLRELSKKSHIDELILFIAVSIVLLFFSVFFNIRYLHFQLIACHFTYFVIGYCIKRFEQTMPSKANSYILILCIWFFMGWFWNKHELPQWIAIESDRISSISLFIYQWITAFCAIVSIIGIGKVLITRENKILMILSCIGKKSLGIYTLHSFFVGPILMMLVDTWGVTLSLLATVALSILLSIAVIDMTERSKLAAWMLYGKERKIVK